MAEIYDDKTLRQALMATGSRIIKPAVGFAGWITLDSDIIPTNGNFTLLGEGRLGIRGAGIRLNNGVGNVIIRNVRMWHGAYYNGTTIRGDCLQINSGAHDVRIEHCDFRWGVDENVSTRGTRVTFTDCVIAEALNDSVHPEGEHSKGLAIFEGADYTTVLRCLLNLNVDRNPMIQSGRTDVINTITGNCDLGMFSNPTQAIYPNLIGCQIVTGPKTTVNGAYVRIFEPDPEYYTGDVINMHVADCLSEHRSAEDPDIYAVYRGDQDPPIQDATRWVEDQFIPLSVSSSSIMTPEAALTYVLANAGVTANRITEDDRPADDVQACVDDPVTWVGAATAFVDDPDDTYGDGSQWSGWPTLS